VFNFFRVYNKIILAVGGVLLMIAFLVPQAVEMFGPSSNQALGRAHGQKITNTDTGTADYELRLLQGLRPFNTAVPTDDELVWLLLQRDAQHLGLYVSNREVALALQAFGYDEEVLAQIAFDRKTTTAFIHQAVRHWLIAEQYRQLFTATTYRDPGVNSPSLAIQRIETVFRYLNQIQGKGLPPELIQRMEYFARLEANGTRRLGGPILRHFIQDNYANLDGRVVLIRPDTASLDTPDEATLAQVFGAYKDALPGQGKPFPFGYKYPDRVKLDYVQIPMDGVRSAVSVEYLDVLDAYQRDPQRFADENSVAADVPSVEAIDTLTRELTDDRAERLAQRIIAQIEGKLSETLRGHPQKDGYIELPEGFTLLGWQDIADAVQAKHGVTIQVMGNPDQWATLSELSGLEGIGQSTIGEDAQSAKPFTTYVSATRRFTEGDDSIKVLRSLRTQVGVASKPLRDSDGNVYLFRLVEVQPAHAPASLDEVRGQVAADAQTIAAYENLIADAGAWKKRAVAQDLDAVAEAGDTRVSQTLPFQRVVGSQGAAPDVLGVGVSREFVDAAFALVDVLDDPQADIAALPREQRVTVTGLPFAHDGPALGVFVLDSFEPLTRSGYESVLSGGAVFSVNSALATPGTVNPLSLEALAKRTGFDLKAYRN